MSQPTTTYTDYTKPTHFMRITKYTNPIVALIGFICIISGLYTAFFIAPTDVTQGEAYRIIYIHVPSAWLAILLYTVVSIFSLLYLVTRHPFAFFTAKSIAVLGIIFTIITLVTGSLWGKPMWGTYWVWDARLTSVLLLFFLYVGYFLIQNALKHTEKAAKFSSVLAIIGFINIPIIKYSVEWWNTLHQPSSITKVYSSIHPSMLVPLLLMFVGLLCFTVYHVSLLIRKHLLERRIDSYKHTLFDPK